MTKAQITTLLGKGSLKPDKDNPNLYTAETVPKPYPDFDDYILIISPEAGLVKIDASTVTLTTNGEGEQLQSEFRKLESALSAKYGEPTGTIDKLKDSGQTTAPRFWMMELRDQDRNLMTYWREPLNEQHIKFIFILAHASSLTTGWVSVAYEFEGFDDYVSTREMKKNAAF
jgi:hypothetical protein